MRLCYVGTLNSIHMQRWIRYFTTTGDEVHLLSPSNTSEISTEGVRLHVFRTFRTRARILDFVLNGLIMIPRILQFRALFRRLSPDVVHVHYINDAAFYAALTGFRPLVVTAWGSDVLIGPRESPLLRWVVGFVLRRADLITCDADHMRDVLIRLGADPSRVAIIYFGTDTVRFSPAQRDQGLRAYLGLAGVTAVLSSRSLEPTYDVETLITAVPLVLDQTPAVKFVIAGSGSEESRLRGMVESLEVGEAVRFVGRLPESEMARYVASADVYVSTAISDGGLAASTAEAMACGLPVIITDVGDNRLWVKDGVNGFIVPPRNPQMLASSIVRLVMDGEVRERFGRNNRRIIEERNNWSKEMARMGQLYGALISRAGATADQVA